MQKQFRGYKFRIGFVGYRNFCDRPNQFEIQDSQLTTRVSRISLKKLEPKGEVILPKILLALLNKDSI